jgi:uncharacterized membrane protein
MTEATAVTSKTTIRPNIANMVKTKGGSYHKDDFIGTTLAGLTVAQVKVIATECGLDVSKYEHLNAGQQRMTLGNSLRKLTNMVDETPLTGPALDKAMAANKDAESCRDQIEELANSMKETAEEAAAAKEAAKAEAKAAKEAAAAAKKAEKAAAKAAKAKVGDDANGEGDTQD